MNNFEYYEEDIRRVGRFFALTLEGKVVRCGSVACKECQFATSNNDDLTKSCQCRALDWLYDKRKEPVLKPCPFCGGEATLNKEYDNTYYAECTRCSSLGNAYGTLEEAV